MDENNLLEIEFLRRERIIFELIKNTGSCCVVWRETAQPGQYTTDTTGSISLAGDRSFTFYISLINSTVYLDVFTNCKRLTTYNSEEYPSLIRLYDTIIGIEQNAIGKMKDAVLAFNKVPRVCGIFYTDYAHGGVVVGGGTEVKTVIKGREGGVIAGGHAPYNQVAEASGGSTMSGEAKVTPYIESPEGGILTSGEAVMEMFLPTGGGVTIGGSALFEITISTSGGTIAGGEAKVFGKRTDESGSGGVILGHEQYLWLSGFSLGTFTEVDLNYMNSSGSSLNGVPVSGDLENFVLDPENRRFFWSDRNNIHRTSQIDYNDDAIIYATGGRSFTMDYDNGVLAFQQGGSIVLTDADGTAINSITPFGVFYGMAVDTTNDLLFVSRNLGVAFGGTKITRYTLSTLTEESNHPPSYPGTIAPERVVADRDSKVIFYGLRAGALQGNMRIYKLAYDFSSEEIINPGGGSGQTLGFDVDEQEKKLFVWYKKNTEHFVTKMDYDGSNEEIVHEGHFGSGSFVAWLRVNSPVDFAIVEHIPAPDTYDETGSGGITISGIANQNVISFP